MPRVGRAPPPVRKRPPLDRPGRWRVLLRRQRRLLRPALALCAVGAVAVAGITLVETLGHGESFHERLGHATARLGLRVEKVLVEGRQKTPEPLLRAAIGAQTGDPLLTYSLSEARARIESIQWVKAATVQRRLPDTLIVSLDERRPFAVWQHDGKFVLIDRAGNTVTDSDVAAFANQVPLVVGAGAPEAAATLIDALAAHPGLQSRVAASVRVGARRWNLHLANGIDVELPEGAVPQALAKLAQLERDHKLLDRPLQVVDLRLPDRLTIRPLPAADAPKDTPPKPGDARKPA